MQATIYQNNTVPHSNETITTEETVSNGGLLYSLSKEIFDIWLNLSWKFFPFIWEADRRLRWHFSGGKWVKFVSNWREVI